MHIKGRGGGGGGGGGGGVVPPLLVVGIPPLVLYRLVLIHRDRTVLVIIGVGISNGISVGISIGI